MRQHWGSEKRVLAEIQAAPAGPRGDSIAYRYPPWRSHLAGLRVGPDLRRPADIIDAPADFLTALELEKHLSPTRSNGLASMLQAIRVFAGEARVPA